jgi:hypothetical protein
MQVKNIVQLAVLARAHRKIAFYPRYVARENICCPERNVAILNKIKIKINHNGRQSPCEIIFNDNTAPIEII